MLGHVECTYALDDAFHKRGNSTRQKGGVARLGSTREVLVDEAPCRSPVLLMANDLPVQYFHGRDGAQLAFREMGEGRPLVLIHGFFSTATVNWVRYGHAAKIAALGYRVVMP